MGSRCDPNSKLHASAVRLHASLVSALLLWVPVCRDKQLGGERWQGLRFIRSYAARYVDSERGGSCIVRFLVMIS